MSSSIYNVGVHLEAHDGVSGVLANISHSMLGLHGGIHNLQQGFSSLQLGVLGAAAVAAGVKIGHVVENLVEHGMELKHWQSQLSAAGFTAKEVAEATGTAWAVAGKNMNTTASENLKNIIELNKATGNLGESMKLLPSFAIAENVIQSVKASDIHASLTKNSTQTLNFARGLEELGVTQMGKTEAERESSVKKYANEYLKTMIASRGLFDGNALYAMTNNSGGAAQNWDMRMATAVAPILGDIMKASKLGNADYMAIRSYQGGHITSDAVEALRKYRLAGDDETYQDKRGWHLKANSNFAKGMETNLWDWSAGLLEKMKKSGIDVTNQHSVNAMVNEIGSNKSTTMMMRALLEPLTRMQIDKELKLRDKVGGDAAGTFAEQDPMMKLDALKKKWDDFLTALGGPLVDPAMKVLGAMTHSINDWAQYFAKHQGQAELISKSLIAVSAGLTAIGTVLIGTAIVGAIGAGGWLVVGIGALGAAVAALHSGDWKDLGKIKPFGDGVDKFFENYFENLKDGMAKDFGSVDKFFGTYFKNIREGVTKDFGIMLQEVESWPAKLGSAIEKMGKSLVEMIGAELKSVAGQLGGWFGGLFHKSSFEGGGGTGGGFINASWDGGDATNLRQMSALGNGGIVNTNGGVINIVSGGGGAGFDGGNGGGIIRASYGGGGSGGRHGGGGGFNDTSGGGGLGDFSKDQMARGMHAMDILVGKGWTEEAAASMISQSMEESGIHPNPKGHADGGTAHGMNQWRFERFAHLKEFAAKLGKPWTDFDTQVLFADAEARKSYNGDAWSKTHDLHAGGLYGKRYEGYGTNSFADRLANSRALLRAHSQHKMPGPPPMQAKEHTIVVPVHLDGKVMAKVVTKHQTRMAKMPHAIGGHDDYGSWASAGTTAMPA